MIAGLAMLAVLVVLVTYLVRRSSRDRALTGSWARAWQYVVVGALMAGGAAMFELAGNLVGISMMALALLVGGMRVPEAGED